MYAQNGVKITTSRILLQNNLGKSRTRRGKEAKRDRERARDAESGFAGILPCPSEMSYSCRVPRRQYFTPVPSSRDSSSPSRASPPGVTSLARPRYFWRSFYGVPRSLITARPSIVSDVTSDSGKGAQGMLCVGLRWSLSRVICLRTPYLYARIEKECEKGTRRRKGKKRENPWFYGRDERRRDRRSICPGEEIPLYSASVYRYVYLGKKRVASCRREGFCWTSDSSRSYLPPLISIACPRAGITTRYIYTYIYILRIILPNMDARLLPFRL